MTNHRLNIVSVSGKSEEKEDRQQKIQAKFEKQWSIDPTQFDPERNAPERERLKRTLSLIPNELNTCTALDLGSGSGKITRILRNRGAKVDAVDIAKSALKLIANEENINPIEEYIPRTTLKEDHYDIIICTELIAYLLEDEYRLLFSELARIIKPEGLLIFSTPLNFQTESPLQRLATFAETEFVVEKWVLSYHCFYIHLRNFFEAPARFVRASKDAEYRQKKLDTRQGFSRLWFRCNSHPLPALLWFLVQWISKPLARSIRQSRSILLALEKCTRFLFSDTGITHAIFTAKRSSLETIPKDKQPLETKHKKQLWE